MPATLLKRDSNTGVSCEYWEFFKNNIFMEYFWGLLLVIFHPTLFYFNVVCSVSRISNYKQA